MYTTALAAHTKKACSFDVSEREDLAQCSDDDEQLNCYPNLRPTFFGHTGIVVDRSLVENDTQSHDDC
jgi:hypothetical protein